MDHGLAQYEARERLLWFLFLLACLLMAFPAVWIHLAGVPRTPVVAATSEALKSYGFWSQRHWMHVGPLGKVLAYLAWVAILFILARFVWLIAQFIGKSSLLSSLREVMSAMKSRQAAKPWSIFFPYFQVTLGRLRTGIRRYLNLGYPIIMAPKAR